MRVRKQLTLVLKEEPVKPQEPESEGVFGVTKNLTITFEAVMSIAEEIRISFRKSCHERESRCIWPRYVWTLVQAKNTKRIIRLANRITLWALKSDNLFLFKDSCIYVCKRLRSCMVDEFTAGIITVVYGLDGLHTMRLTSKEGVPIKMKNSRIWPQLHC